MHGLVITVSDRAAAGQRIDTGGPLAVEMLEAYGVEIDQLVVVPDDAIQIADAVRAGVGAGLDLIVTTGGTGIGPRDVTPEATRPLLDREIRGIAETLRLTARDRVPTSILSRGVAGLAGRTLVVNLPGSVGGVRDGLHVLGPLLAHIFDQLGGGDH